MGLQASIFRELVLMGSVNQLMIGIYFAIPLFTRFCRKHPWFCQISSMNQPVAVSSFSRGGFPGHGLGDAGARHPGL